MKELLEQRHKEAELIFGKTIFPRESIEDEDVKAMEKIISFHDQTVIAVLEKVREEVMSMWKTPERIGLEKDPTDLVIRNIAIEDIGRKLLVQIEELKK